MNRIDSVYDEKGSAANAVKDGKHRSYIGGLWDEMGILQLEFLIGRGLKPSDKVLDLGCGCLRAGVHLVEYLDTGNYFGIDINEELLTIGYDVELNKLGLCGKLPRHHLIANGKFSVDDLPKDLDVILTTSVFTHLSFNRIRLCLESVHPALRPGGVFYASVFVAPDDQPTYIPVVQLAGEVTSYADEDPYHYRISDLEYAALGLPWRLEWIGDWKHFRNQKMVAFHKL